MDELIARFGGDEFLALFENPAGEAHADASAFVERARRRADPTIRDGWYRGVPGRVGGRCRSTRSGLSTRRTLLSNAEAAMYQAKRRGGSNMETFGESMRVELLDRMTTEHSLHRALERSELTLHYQPVVEIDGETTVGVEALIRWQHPDQGLVVPVPLHPGGRGERSHHPHRCVGAGAGLPSTPRLAPRGPRRARRARWR